MQTVNVQLPNPIKALLWGAAICACVFFPRAAQAETFTGLTASYFEYAVANGWAKVNADGEEEYDSGYEGEDDVDNDGLLNEEEWNGWQTAINGRPGWFTCNTSNITAGVVHFGPGSNPQRFDSDCDGMSDLMEYYSGTNPRSGDTDGDGLKDPVEIYAGMNPLDDGFIYDNTDLLNPVKMTDATGEPMRTLWHPDMDIDGDGLTTKAELKKANDLSFGLGCPVLGETRAPFPYTELDAASWSNPLDCDTDSDWLLDSFEKAWKGFNAIEAAPVGDTYHYNTDADRDGLTNFREQCLHPLLAHAWGNPLATWPFGKGKFKDAAGEGSFYVEQIGTRYGSNGKQVSGRILEGMPGYLQQAQFNKIGDKAFYYKNSYDGSGTPSPELAGLPGTVRWPGPKSYWTSPRPVIGAEDYDGDGLPDGWEVEHGLNPLSGYMASEDDEDGEVTTIAIFMTVATDPSTALGDPDGDGLLNLEEYYGADGYRIDLITGTGDETIPWVTRALNYPSQSTFENYLNDNWILLRHDWQAPVGYDLVTGLDTVYAMDIYPGFFNPTMYSSVVTNWVYVDPMDPSLGITDVTGPYLLPAAGVPAFPLGANDMETLALIYGPDFVATLGAGGFQPYATAYGALYYIDTNGDGRYTPGFDNLWFASNAADTFTPADPLAMPPVMGDLILSDPDGTLTAAVAPLPGGYSITDNAPLMVPMPGWDTDSDGLSDAMEIQMDVARGKQPSSPVQSLNPLVSRSAKITQDTGSQTYFVDYPFYFSRDFTVEAWVYLEGDAPAGGSVIKGFMPFGTGERKAYDLGVTNMTINGKILDTVPYVGFHTLGGVWYQTSATRPLPRNRWVHLAGTFKHGGVGEGNTLSLYIDGTLVQSRQVIQESIGAYLLKNWGAGGTIAFATGTDFANRLWIDELRIWGVERTSAEVAENRGVLQQGRQNTVLDRQDLNSPLLAYYNFDDGGDVAVDGRHRAFSSLLNYNYPGAGNVENRLFHEYFYPDRAYALPTEDLGGGFVFDAGRTAPVSGELDSQRGELDSDGDGLPDSWEIVHEMNPFAWFTKDHVYSQYDSGWAQVAAAEVLIRRSGRTFSSSLDAGATWLNATCPEVVSTINGVVVVSLCPNAVLIGEYAVNTNSTVEGTNTTTVLNTTTNWEIRSGQVLGFIDDGETWWVSKSGVAVAQVGETGKMISDADGDPDNDGLSNLEEYWARTNPRSFDTDENSIPDGDEDFDGDGLSNEQESRNACRPDLADTDDDGMTDSAEVAVGSIPSDSTSPKQHLAAYFNGKPGTWLEVLDRNGLVQSSWTLEAQVLPAGVDFLADGQGAPIFRRAVEEATNGMYVANYELRVVRVGANLYPEARFVYKTTKGAGVPMAVRGTNALRVSATHNPTSVNHLAATYDSLGKRLTLYVDGEQVGLMQDPNHSAPTTGEGPASVIRIGERFQGFVDELRLWSEARDRSAIMDAMSQTLEGQEDGLAAYFNFDDGGWPTITSNTWATGMANLLYSVKAVDPVPAEVADMLDGDTWVAGADVWVNDSGNHQILGTVAALGPIFYGTDTILPAGGGVEGNFGWNDAERILYRHDGTGFEPWGKGRHWLMDARGVIVNDVADFTAMMVYTPEPTLGDLFLCVAEQAIYVYNPQGMEIMADPLMSGHRFYSVADNAIVEWDGAAVQTIASAITDTNLYITIQSEGLAYKSEDKIWRRWGVIPTTEDYTVPRDWENQWAAAAWMSGLVEFYETAEAATGYVASGGKDTDGDGLPDSWEIRYGLNPNNGGFGGVASGSGVDLNGDGRLDYVYNTADFVNGAWGDPDGDGLNNRAEWLAGTNPFEFDTDGDGFGDFDSPRSGATYGSLYMDGDNIPDGWESLFPNACSPLKFDANLDPDGDGWDNYAEYMAYYLTRSANVYTVTTNSDGTVSSNWSGGSGYSIPYCDPEDPISYPKPRMTFRFKTDCPEAIGTLRIWAYGTPEMNCPDAMTSLALNAPIRDGNSLSITDFTDGGHLRQGPTYFMAFVDENNDGQWNEPELMGFSEYMPENISWGEADVEIALREQANGYTRIGWAGVESSDTNVAASSSYVVRILREGAVVHEFARGGCSANRSYLHEFDFRHAGFSPLYGNYTWQVRNAANELMVAGTNKVDYPAGLTKPTIQSPSMIIYAQEKLRMGLDPATAQIGVQIRRGATNGPIVLNQTVHAPYIKNGVGEMALPLLAGYGAFTNGAYWIQVRAFNPRASVLSDWRSFSVDLQPPAKGGAGMISGRADYFGWANNPAIVVEAYQGSGFDQRPAAKVRVVGSYYKLMGLPIGDYYVRAFHDLNENGMLDPGESWSLVKGAPDSVRSITWVQAVIRSLGGDERRDSRSDGKRGGVATTPAPNAYAADYSVKRIEMKSTAEVAGNNMVLHDADSDNDGLADIWEKTFAGGGLSVMNQYTNNDADDLLDLQEFRAGTNPRNPDTDGDTLDDYQELMVLGTDPTKKDTDGDGVDDNVELMLGTDPLNPDSDGDGLSDGAELHSFGTDPTLTDTDGDGMPDGFEITNGFNPLSAADANEDADNDGLSNKDEAAQGTDPLNPDTDGDGYTDGAEIAVGSNPMNAGSIPPAGISGDLRISAVERTAEGYKVMYQVDAANPVPVILEFLVNDDLTDEAGWEVVPGLQPVVTTVPSSGLSATVPNTSGNGLIFIRIRSK